MATKKFDFYRVTTKNKKWLGIYGATTKKSRIDIYRVTTLNAVDT